MSTSREGPNPLRPYYVPPSIGIPQEIPATISGTHRVGLKNGSAASYASSARDIFSDIDYSDYLSDTSPSTIESLQRFINETFTNYAGILCGQPFEVAKTILQVKIQDMEEGAKPVAAVEKIKRRPSEYNENYPSDDSDADETTYFTSAAPEAKSLSPSRRRYSSEGSGWEDKSVPKITPPKPKPAHQLILKRSDSIMEVIAQEWSREGVWGVWKGSNATFIYGFLAKTVESWSSSMISAVLNIPDPGLATLGAQVDVAGSPSPWTSLSVAIAAAATASLILAPLDLVRTKLILTPTANPKRSLTHNLKTLPSFICPPLLLIPTILHSIIKPTISHCTPLILRTRLAIDPVLTPTSYTTFTFLAQTLEIFIRLPLETVLRRAQAAVLISPQYNESQDLKTVVDIGPYNGVVGTMWSIAREEGESSSPEPIASVGAAKQVRKVKKVQKKGQGIEGLWRGWRVGVWGLVGMYGSKAMSGVGSTEGEF
ncbi:136fe9c1-c4ae-4e3a-9f58-e95f29528b66 [Sclerotinia trifoliorum]|uniref:136fe9c1-c4ae-4e3a-9f58-e95f29528b66 n=1 Tax=Sclerotinia trifoliorum TaxID=28548 RepID=A0A8H2W2T8_9HELO|nr:136fe9c1-c4ae-4e3a-9f58-e95f29528b66 [Sclerotinia trifoliorum]